MNERIKELLEHVRVNEQIERLAKESGCTIDKLGFGEGNLEKFAELIVRECAELCSTHEMADEPFGEKSYRKGRHFDVMIKKHFGVEE